MKITKAKLKQIISEELSSMSEYGGIYEDEPEMADPVVSVIVKVEELRELVMNGDPGGEGAMAAIDEIHDMLKGMQTGAGNEVAMAQSRQ
jgi:hypothetical protein|tara:strand:- start:77 stop:346 length:270 start_codon:yes stop_codon:yes gene_type:complete